MEEKCVRGRYRLHIFFLSLSLGILERECAAAAAWRNQHGNVLAILEAFFSIWKRDKQNKTKMMAEIQVAS